MIALPSHPVLSTLQARELEAGLFEGSEAREWRAMTAAGRGVAAAVLRDAAEAGGLAVDARILVLAGKGNNAGDGLIAARTLLEHLPKASAEVLFVFGSRRLRPLAARAWRELADAFPRRVRSVGASRLSKAYDLSLGAIFGAQYRPPLGPEAEAAIAAASLCRVRFSAGVDLPSGLDDPGAFRADFTYATGCVKAPLLCCRNAGRPRYLDLGFFPEEFDRKIRAISGDRVLLGRLLAPLAGLRPAHGDKRSQGHLVFMGGSANFPGAALMATRAALRSGVGLVTALVPERLACVFAAQAPEAMWVGLPETPSGGLSSKGLPLAEKAMERASAVAIGPGIGREPDTLAFAAAVAKAAKVPLAVDADALQPEIVRAASVPRVLTPHAGEYARIAGTADLRAYCSGLPAVVVQKGPVTRVSDGGAVYHSFFGGPVLARGGSGDLLAGLVGGLLAQTPDDPLLAACRAAVWHGAAADALARAQGQTAVHTLQVLDFLATALKESVQCQEH